MWTVSFVLFWVWLAALLLSVWAAQVAQRFGVRLPRVVKRPIQREVFPRVAVIVPIKGVDDDTHGNIEALLDQDYPEYRLIFAVESDEDPVVGLLEKIAANDSRVEIVIAGLARERGQKVHNQLAAVGRTTERDEVLAFMDADAKPGPGWVHALVTPLTYGDAHRGDDGVPVLHSGDGAHGEQDRVGAQLRRWRRCWGRTGGRLPGAGRWRCGGRIFSGLGCSGCGRTRCRMITCCRTA